MALGELDILNNLVYGIFGEPFYFGVIISLIFIYYSIQYDIPKWSLIAFFVPLGIWIGYYYLPLAVLVILIIFIGLLFGPRLFRAMRN